MTRVNTIILRIIIIYTLSSLSVINLFINTYRPAIIIKRQPVDRLLRTLGRGIYYNSDLRV